MRGPSEGAVSNAPIREANCEGDAFGGELMALAQTQPCGAGDVQLKAIEVGNAALWCSGQISVARKAAKPKLRLAAGRAKWGEVSGERRAGPHRPLPAAQGRGLQALPHRPVQGH